MVEEMCLAFGFNIVICKDALQWNVDSIRRDVFFEEIKKLRLRKLHGELCDGTFI